MIASSVAVVRRIKRQVHARPRLLSAGMFGVVVFALTPAGLIHHAGSRFLVGWNAGALLYLALAVHMVTRSDAELMKARGQEQEDGRAAVLLFVVLAAFIVLYGIASQLAAVKAMSGAQRSTHILMAALTVVTSWLFTQTMLALQYAHDFYLARLRELPDPLIFPGTVDPTYPDFMYFACVIGTSGQTADVSFNGSALRGMGLLHCVLAFFFNTTVLALTINIAAGLF